MANDSEVLSVKDSRKFQVHCRAVDAGELCVGAESVSVKVGQRLRRDGGEEIWHSVGVYAKEDEKMGTLRFVPLCSTQIGRSHCKSPR
jgi:hypothetical protein